MNTNIRSSKRSFLTAVLVVIFFLIGATGLLDAAFVMSARTATMSIVVLVCTIQLYKREAA